MNKKRILFFTFFIVSTTLLLVACSGVIGGGAVVKISVPQLKNSSRFISNEADRGYVIVLNQDKIYSSNSFEDSYQLVNGEVVISNLPVGVYVFGVVFNNEAEDKNVGLAFRTMFVRPGLNTLFINVGAGVSSFSVDGIEFDNFIDPPGGFNTAFTDNTVIVYPDKYGKKVEEVKYELAGIRDFYCTWINAIPSTSTPQIGLNSSGKGMRIDVVPYSLEELLNSNVSNLHTDIISKKFNIYPPVSSSNPTPPVYAPVKMSDKVGFLILTFLIDRSTDKIYYYNYFNFVFPSNADDVGRYMEAAQKFSVYFKSDAFVYDFCNIGN